MTFRRTYSIIICIVFFIIFIASSYFYGFAREFLLEISIVFVLFEIYLVTSFFVFKNNKIIKYSFFIKQYEFTRNEIVRIEAVTKKKFGYLHYVGRKSLSEDYYIFVLRDDSKIEVDMYYMNKGRTLGRYLNEVYKIRLIPIEKIKYLYNS